MVHFSVMKMENQLPHISFQQFCTKLCIFWESIQKPSKPTLFVSGLRHFYIWKAVPRTISNLMVDGYQMLISPTFVLIASTPCQSKCIFTNRCQLLLQSACTSMCRHIYDWNIVNCDVKQQIHLTSSSFAGSFGLSVLQLLKRRNNLQSRWNWEPTSESTLDIK